MPRKRIGAKLDILFEALPYELGAIKDGYFSDINSEKTLNEAGLKLPKTLKDIFLSLILKAPSEVHNIRTANFIVSGTEIFA